MPVAYLTRTVKICASHRLHNKKLSDEKNREIYGKCNNPNGHGHNYTFEITIRGRIDPETGFVMNICTLKECMNRAIMEPLDHKCIDKDVPYFENVVSTTENLAVFAWEKLSELLPGGLLYEVKIHETDNNTVIYRGEE
jgi:6-pyruvoyltetrahydropterin/6-carboxytetrahydropterin synthase